MVSKMQRCSLQELLVDFVYLHSGNNTIKIILKMPQGADFTWQAKGVLGESIMTGLVQYD